MLEIAYEDMKTVICIVVSQLLFAITWIRGSSLINWSVVNNFYNRATFIFIGDYM
jgi:hypothetical protein